VNAARQFSREPAQPRTRLPPRNTSWPITSARSNTRRPWRSRPASARRVLHPPAARQQEARAAWPCPFFRFAACHSSTGCGGIGAVDVSGPSSPIGQGFGSCRVLVKRPIISLPRPRGRQSGGVRGEPSLTKRSQYLRRGMTDVVTRAVARISL